MSIPLQALRPLNDNDDLRRPAPPATPRPIANDVRRSAVSATLPAVPVALRPAFTRLAAGEDGMLGLIRETVAVRKAALRALLSSDMEPTAMQQAATRFADDMVVGAFRAARARVGQPTPSLVAPLSVVAVGRYGRQALMPTERPELLFLVVTAAGRPIPAVIEDGLNLLHILGFDVDYAVVMLESADAADRGLDLRLRDSRLLWGRTDLYARARGR